LKFGQKKLLRIMIRYGYLGARPTIMFKEDKLDLRVRKCMFVEFKKSVKGYKIWDSKDKKFILSRDVTLDEVSMMKPKDFQQVESKATDRILQEVDSDATSPSLEK